jgi:hypothetical protein
MGSRRICVLWHVLGVALALMLVVSVPGQMVLRCHMDGRVRASCCCPRQDSAAAEPAGAVLKQQACCDPEITSQPLPVAETPRVSKQNQPPVVVFPSSVVALWSPMVVWPPGQLGGCGPPPQGPSIVVLKQAFLI